MIAGSYDKRMFAFKETASISKWLNHFSTPSAMNESCYCSTSLPTIGVVNVVDFYLSNKCAVYHFNLHFDDDLGCGAFFHILIFSFSLERCLLRALAHF